MDNVFDKAKKKTSAYIASTVLDQVIASKTPEYIQTLTKMTEEFLNDPKTKAKINKEIERTFQDFMNRAIDTAVLGYFKSKEFKEKCNSHAKGLLK
jgi:hypothetical protein